MVHIHAVERDLAAFQQHAANSSRVSKRDFEQVEAAIATATEQENKEALTHLAAQKESLELRQRGQDALDLRVKAVKDVLGDLSPLELSDTNPKGFETLVGLLHNK